MITEDVLETIVTQGPTVDSSAKSKRTIQKEEAQIKKEKEQLMKEGKCFKCKGMGRTPDGKSICTECNGTGKINDINKENI